jgi:hypothetical protein
MEIPLPIRPVERIGRSHQLRRAVNGELHRLPRVGGKEILAKA